MTSSRKWLTCCVILASGCGGDGFSRLDNLNPYATNPGQQSAPPPGSVRPSQQGSSGDEEDDGAPPVVLPETGYAAEMGVPLSLLEYLRFARQSKEMLHEMTEIHADVSESGDAEPHQKRWGQLTASHTKLVRDVAQAAYPPADLARELQELALPALSAEIERATSVMEEFDDVEGGLAQPHAEAKMILEHLSKNLIAEESVSSSEG